MSDLAPLSDEHLPGTAKAPAPPGRPAGGRPGDRAHATGEPGRSSPLPAPANPTPANPTPANPTPANPTPANPTPVGATPAGTSPAGTSPAGTSPAASPAGTTRPPRTSRTGLTLNQRLSAGFLVVGVFLGASLGVAGWAYDRQVNGTGHLVNVVDKARLEAAALLGDYVDEETGVRGYILSGQPSFLQPYDLGISQARADGAKLAIYEARDPSSQRLLGGVDAAVHNWETTFALPAIAATRRGDRSFASPAELQKSKEAFDQVRARFSQLDAALEASAASSKATVNQSQDIFVAVAIALVLVLIGSALAGAWALQTWVLSPLEGLQDDVKEVAGGELGHAVVPVGPPDLAALACDVDSMRQRILTEVESLARATQELRTLNEDLSRSNLELEQFAYVASHDLQEPLRKVVSFCELLEARYRGQIDDRGRQYIEFAVDGARRMQGLINDLLAFSRVGRTTSAFEKVRLAEVFAQTLANLGAMIEEKKATVTATILPAVYGDQALLTTVFQNLIGNALKFNKSGRPAVEVEAKREGEEWEISVTDNGIGIEPRFAERVFVIFQRLHGREDYEGTGIGLALCKKIVEFHGGRIWLDTCYSAGARISFSLPASATSVPTTSALPQEPE